MNILQIIINFITGKPSHAGQLLLKVERLVKQAEVVLGGHNKELDYVIEHIKALEAARTVVVVNAAKASAVLTQLKTITDAVGTIASS